MCLGEYILYPAIVLADDSKLRLYGFLYPRLLRWAPGDRASHSRLATGDRWMGMWRVQQWVNLRKLGRGWIDYSHGGKDYRCWHISGISVEFSFNNYTLEKNGKVTNEGIHIKGLCHNYNRSLYIVSLFLYCFLMTFIFRVILHTCSSFSQHHYFKTRVNISLRGEELSKHQ